MLVQHQRKQLTARISMLSIAGDVSPIEVGIIVYRYTPIYRLHSGRFTVVSVFN